MTETKSRWAVLRRWRDWGIPVKLAAVTLVPVIFAIVLGALQINSQIDRADAYRKIDQLVAVNDALRTTVTDLQRERVKAAVLIAARVPDIAVHMAPVPGSPDADVDAHRAKLIETANRVVFTNETTTARRAEAIASLGELDALRAQVVGHAVDGPTALAAYTSVIRALIAFDRAAAEEVADLALSGTAGTLRDLEAAREEVYYQQGLVGIGVARGSMNAAEQDALRSSQARLEDRTASLRAIATPAQQAEYDKTVPDADVVARTTVVRQALAVKADKPLPITMPYWNTVSDAVSGKLNAVSAMLGEQLKTASAGLQDSASDAAGAASVILIIALVAAVAIMFVIGSHLLRSLSTLRHSALDIAEHRLPAAVARLRDGRDLVVPTVEPVPVTSQDEVGAVARAFDAVHQEAVRLATEQASIRANYAGVFVNLSRRSQGLVQRQLTLLERLERDEEDADQLATLFQLDHLATRMRRNNENLMVLSGTALGEAHTGRRSQQPVSLADLLRAAVSEVEQYQRIVIAPPPSVLIVGYAVGDLVRLTAELLDNAAAFSPPATQVTISSQHTKGGVVRIEVSDRGIGMKAEELAETNTRLAEGGAVDESTSRRMGLFVVGRLAARHGVKVRLKPGDPTGVRAMVTIPSELATANVVELPKATPAAREPEPTETNGHHVNGSSANGSAVNGSSANGSKVNGTNGSNGSKKVNGTNGSTVNGLPRRAVNRSSAALTPGDGASMPESLPQQTSVPTPRDAAESVDRLPDTAATADMPWPTHSVPADADPADSAGVPELFTPAMASEPGEDGGWWDATVVGSPDLPAERGVQETTPIFDAMVSAWFRTVTDDPNSTAADAVRVPDWAFAADSGFQTAQAVQDAQPEEYTENGLPRRTPRRNLVPGSAITPQEPPAVADRDPEDLRSRLSSYQKGVSRARGAHHTGPAHGSQERPANGLDLSGARWRFADAGWTAADSLAVAAVSNVDTQSDDGALPRRTPRELLLPGSLDPLPANGSAAGKPAGARLVRDADALRTRLEGLQRGIGRGRDSLARQAGEHDHGNGAR